VAEKVRHEAWTASGIREVEKSIFFLVKMGFSLPNQLFFTLKLLFFTLELLFFTLDYFSSRWKLQREKK
jgi:hypothetical protein